MTTGKVRATGCSRFLFAMIFIVPAAYFISMYLTGESVDFKQKFNDLIGNQTIEQVDDSPKKEKKKNTTTLNEKKEEPKEIKEPVKKENSISEEDLKKIADYKSRNSRLQDELDQKKQTIRNPLQKN